MNKINSIPAEERESVASSRAQDFSQESSSPEGINLATPPSGMAPTSLSFLERMTMVEIYQNRSISEMKEMRRNQEDTLITMSTVKGAQENQAESIAEVRSKLDQTNDLLGVLVRKLELENSPIGKRAEAIKKEPVMVDEPRLAEIKMLKAEGRPAPALHNMTILRKIPTRLPPLPNSANPEMDGKNKYVYFAIAVKLGSMSAEWYGIKSGLYVPSQWITINHLEDDFVVKIYTGANPHAVKSRAKKSLEAYASSHGNEVYAPGYPLLWGDDEACCKQLRSLDTVPPPGWKNDHDSNPSTFEEFHTPKGRSPNRLSTDYFSPSGTDRGD